MGKPRKPLLDRLHEHALDDIKRDAKSLPANRVTMRDLLLEAEARIRELESDDEPEAYEWGPVHTVTYQEIPAVTE